MRHKDEEILFRNEKEKYKVRIKEEELKEKDEEIRILKDLIERKDSSKQAPWTTVNTSVHTEQVSALYTDNKKLLIFIFLVLHFDHSYA